MIDDPPTGFFMRHYHPTHPFVSLFTVILCACFCQHVIAQQPPTVLTGGHVVNPQGIASIENAVIVIEDGQIAAIGKEGELDIPEQANVIDVTGKWVIPGLVDAHVHFFQSGGLYTRPDALDLRGHVSYAEEQERIKEGLTDTFKRYLRSGVTSVVDVGGPFWNFDVRDQALKTALAPRVAVAGPLVSTYQPDALTTDDPPIIKVETEEESRMLVRRQVERGTDLIKIWYIVFPGQSPADNLHLIEATIEESHKAGVRVAVHATELETARAAVRAGADILVHGVFNELVDAAFIDLLLQNEVIFTPTLVALPRYEAVFTQQIEFVDAEYEIANPNVMSSLFDLRHLPEEGIPVFIKNAISDPESFPRMSLDVPMENVKRVHEAGVIVAAGTDAGNIGTLHGPTIFREFELMEEAGMSPLDILTSATLHGAKVMGREEELGSLEQGKLADMVVLNDDPRSDVAHFSSIDRVIKGGTVYEPSQIISKSPVDVVQQQVNAYNAKDIDAFLATYSSDVELYMHPDSLFLSGHEGMRESYGPFFSTTPQLHVEILSRMTSGNVVIDKERVTGLAGGRIMEAIAIYRVKEDLIDRVWFVFE